MYKIVKECRAVQAVILILALCIIATIYPVRMWEETIPSVSNQNVAGATDSIGEDYLLQRFIAQYDHLGTINLYIADFEKGWNRDKEVNSFIFRMLDSDMQIMFEEFVDVRFVDMPGFCPIYVNEPVEVGKDYYFFLQGQDGSRAWFGVEETANAGTPYVSRLVYNYDEVQGYNVIAEYNYTVPLRKDKIVAYCAVLFAAALALIALTELFYRKFRKDRLITVEKAFRMTANLLICAGVVTAVTAIVPLRMFDFRLTDNIFYAVGVLLTAAVLLYAVNRKRNRKDYVPFLTLLRDRWPDWLQAVFIAGAVWACVNYMNGLYDIHHKIAERQFMMFFALAVITMCKKKEILSKGTALYGIVAAAAGVWYYQSNVYGVPDAELGVQALRYGVIACILCGFVVLNVISLLLKKKRPAKVSVWFGILLLLFFILIAVFSNGRGWTLAMVLSFSVYYMRFALWDRRSHLLQNMSNGILLHFVCAVVFSVLHRPFLSWIYPRFPFIFHTVTVTAVYLMVVLGAAVARLLDRYRECTKISYLWKELLLMGIALTYLLFTASRTGFLSAAVLIVLAVVLAAAGKGKGKLRNIAVICGWMAAALIVCFPMVFTAQRILPAVTNDVRRFEIEEFPDAITRGNEWNSMYYINIERFIEVFNNKIFGIPEGGSSSYERSSQYQEYRAKRFNNKGEVVWEGSMDELYQQAEDTGGGTEQTKAAAEEKADKPLNIIGNKSEEERAQDQAAADQLEQEAQTGNFEEPEEEEVPEEDMSVYQATEEYANGRMDIYRAYVEQLTINGHEEMGAVLPDGSLAVHAHNIYLQVAYDHGILVGILFVVIGGGAFVQGILYFRKKRNTTACACLPAAYVAGFAVAGLVEWIFHLCNPAGFVLLLLLAPLLFDMGGSEADALIGAEKDKS